MSCDIPMGFNGKALKWDLCTFRNLGEQELIVQQLSQPVLADYVNGMHGRLKESRKSAEEVLAENVFLENRLAGEKIRRTCEAQAHHDATAQHKMRFTILASSFTPSYGAYIWAWG